MDLRRRFIFHGNAAAIGGRLVRPSDVMLETPVASSLAVVGGRTQAQAGPTRFGNLVSFGSAATFAEGVFDDFKQQVEFSYHRVEQDTLTMTTRVRADVTDLSVDEKPKLTIKHVHAAMTSTSPAGSGEPSIVIDNDTTIDGAAIDGYGLVVELALDVFQRCDTRSRLLTAADDPEFVRASGSLLFMTSDACGVAAPPAGRLLRGSGLIYATIVKAITWSGASFAGATIDNHIVTVPDFGKIFFGELLISDTSRRLTMVRMELGSPSGGETAVAEVDSNGTWST
jgi:hypothetical protein